MEIRTQDLLVRSQSFPDCAMPREALTSKYLFLAEWMGSCCVGGSCVVFATLGLFLAWKEPWGNFLLKPPPPVVFCQFCFIQSKCWQPATLTAQSDRDFPCGVNFVHVSVAFLVCFESSTKNDETRFVANYFILAFLPNLPFWANLLFIWKI